MFDVQKIHGKRQWAQSSVSVGAESSTRVLKKLKISWDIYCPNIAHDAGEYSRLVSFSALAARWNLLLLQQDEALTASRCEAEALRRQNAEVRAMYNGLKHQAAVNCENLAQQVRDIKFTSQVAQQETQSETEQAQSEREQMRLERDSASAEAEQTRSSLEAVRQELESAKLRCVDLESTRRELQQSQQARSALEAACQEAELGKSQGLQRAQQAESALIAASGELEEARKKAEESDRLRLQDVGALQAELKTTQASSLKFREYLMAETEIVRRNNAANFEAGQKRLLQWEYEDKVAALTAEFEGRLSAQAEKFAAEHHELQRQNLEDSVCQYKAHAKKKNLLVNKVKELEAKMTQLFAQPSSDSRPEQKTQAEGSAQPGEAAQSEGRIETGGKKEDEDEEPKPLSALPAFTMPKVAKRPLEGRAWTNDELSKEFGDILNDLSNIAGGFNEDSEDVRMR